METLIKNLQTELDETLSLLELKFNSENEHLLKKYENAIQSNKEKYKLDKQKYIDEFNYIVKNIKTLHDVYIVTSSQIHYNNMIKQTFQRLPDLNMASYNMTCTIEDVNKNMRDSIVKLYKTDEINSEIKAGFVGTENIKPYCEIKYNTFNGIAYKSSVLCIAEPLDIIILYNGKNAEFYRLSTGTKLYKDYIYKDYMNEKYYKYYNNSIILIYYNRCGLDSRSALNIVYYDIAPDFTVSSRPVQIYSRNSHYGKMTNLVHLFNACKLHHLTFNTTTSEIYGIIKNHIHIVKLEKDEYVYNIVNLTNCVSETSETSEPSETQLRELFRTDISVRRSIIDFNIRNSEIVIYSEYFSDHYLSERNSESICRIKIDIKTLLSLISK